MKKLQYFLYILLIVCFATCNKEDEGLNNEQIIADFEYAWHVADTIYPYMEFKNINWDSIYTVYYARAQAFNDPAHLIHDLLSELKDGHVFYHDKNGNMVYVYVPKRIQKDENAVCKILHDHNIRRTYNLTDY